MIIWRTRVSTLPDANDDVQVAGLSPSSSLDTREPHPRHFPREYPFSYCSNSLGDTLCATVISNVVDSVERKRCWGDTSIYYLPVRTYNEKASGI